MAFDTYEVAVKLKLKDEFSDGMKRLDTQLKGAIKHASELQTKLDKICKLPCNPGIGLVKGLKAANDEADKLEKKLLRIKALKLNKVSSAASGGKRSKSSKSSKGSKGSGTHKGTKSAKKTPPQKTRKPSVTEKAISPPKPRASKPAKDAKPKQQKTTKPRTVKPPKESRKPRSKGGSSAGLKADVVSKAFQMALGSDNGPLRSLTEKVAPLIQKVNDFTEKHKSAIDTLSNVYKAATDGKGLSPKKLENVLKAMLPGGENKGGSARESSVPGIKEMEEHIKDAQKVIENLGKGAQKASGLLKNTGSVIEKLIPGGEKLTGPLSKASKILGGIAEYAPKLSTSLGGVSKVLGRLGGPVASAAITGYQIGTEIYEHMNDKQRDIVGGTIANALAFFGVKEAQDATNSPVALDSQASEKALQEKMEILRRQREVREKSKQTVNPKTGQATQVNSTVNIDGKKVAEVVTKHQTRTASRPHGGTTTYDRSRAPTPAAAGA